MSNRKLDMMIDRTVRASNRYHKAQKELNEYCIARWGFEPGDRDLDYIIDSVFGGCGLSDGISAERFIEIMDDAAGE